MNSGNKIKDAVKKVREYYKKHGEYPKGSFTLTKNNALLKSSTGKIRISGPKDKKPKNTPIG